MSFIGGYAMRSGYVGVRGYGEEWGWDHQVERESVREHKGRFEIRRRSFGEGVEIVET